MSIRTYHANDLSAVVALFQRAVHAIDPQMYSRAEQAQWAPYPPDLERWRQKLSQQEVFLYCQEQALAGFMSLEPDGHIDYTYVAPDFQRQGIAQHLYDHVEALAIARCYPRLYVEASRVARPFFEKQGFRLVCVNEHPRGDQILINFSLEKDLSV